MFSKKQGCYLASFLIPNTLPLIKFTILAYFKGQNPHDEKIQYKENTTPQTQVVLEMCHF